MTNLKDNSQIESHVHGPVSGPVHTGSGDIHYHVELANGKKFLFDALRLERLYIERISKRPELREMRTPLGAVEIQKLYVMPQLAPVSWIYGEKHDSDWPESALELLAKFQRIVFFGAPGIGKSTFLKFLLQEMLAEKTHKSFPIFIELYQYSKQHNVQNMLDFAIEHYFRPFYQGEDLEALSLLLRHWKTEGKLIFLLDGLDEVPSNQRDRVLGQIRGLQRFVVTSRPRGRVDAHQESGANYEIRHFSPNEVARFVRKWQKYEAEQGYAESFSAAEFFNYIRRESRIADLVRIPQLLTILCWLWGKGGSHQYGTKGELLAEAANRLIVKAVQLSGLSEETHLTRSRDLRKGLGRLALEMLKQSRRTIPTEEFIEFFEDAGLKEHEELLMVAQRSGLLIPTSGLEDEWQFIHLVFQEYFAADALVRHPGFESELDGILSRADFEECLRMASGLLCSRNLQKYAPRLKILMEKLLASKNSDIFHLNWRLAGLCLSEVQEPQRVLGSIVSDLEVGLLDCASEWWARHQFVEALGRLRTAGMRQRLVQALQKENPYVRWAAAEALGQMGDPETLGEILECIEKEDWPAVKIELIKAVGSIGDRSALAAIRQLLNSSVDDDFILLAIGETLGRLQDVKTLIDLHSTERESDDSDFSKSSTVTLGAYPYLSEDSHVRLHQALEGSGVSIQGGPADAYILDEPTIDELEQRAFSKDPLERLEAVQALGRMGDAGSLFLLFDKLQDEDDEISRTAGKMLRELGEGGEALAYGFLTLLFMTLDGETDKDKEAAAGIIYILWSMPEERNMMLEQRDHLCSDLLAALQDTSFKEKVLSLLESEPPFLIPVIWTLGLLGNSEHADKIGAFLEHEDDVVRCAAAWALGQQENLAMALPLTRCLSNEESIEVLRAACESVAKLRMKEAVNLLVDLLDEETEYSVRKSAIQALTEIGSNQAINPLLALLDDDDDDIRLMSAEAIGKIGAKDAVPALIKMLDDNNVDVLVSATSALGNLHAQQAESRLIKYLSNPESSLRHAAVESLAKIGCRAAIDHLVDMLETDAEQECANAAASAISELADVGKILELIDRLGDARDDDRFYAIANALLIRDDANLRKQILSNLAEKDIWGQVGRSGTLVQLRHDGSCLTLRSNEFLSQYGDTDHDRIEVCKKRLQGDEDEVARWEAAVALGEIKNVAAVSALVNSLLDPCWFVSSASAEALEAISQEIDFAEEIRSERARALSLLQEQGHLPRLVEWLGQFDTEDDWPQLRMVRWALQDIQALDTLMSSYEQGNKQVRQILWEIGDQHGLRFLSKDEIILTSGLRMSSRDATKHFLAQQGIQIGGP